MPHLWGAAPHPTNTIRRACGVALAAAALAMVGATGAQASTQYVFERTWQVDGPDRVATGPDGRVYVTGDDRVFAYSPLGVLLHRWSTVQPGGEGWLNDTAGVAVAPSGEVVVADRAHSRIHRYRSDGTLLGMFGHGSLDSTAPGIFRNPSGLDVGPDGRVYVADALHHRIQSFLGDGAQLAVVGSEGVGPGQFDYPWDVAVAPNGDVYVADRHNDRIQRLGADGSVRAVWGQRGTGPGQLSSPRGVAADGDRGVFAVSDAGIFVQRFSPSGRLLARFGGERGRSWGRLAGTQDVAVDRTGAVYVVDRAVGHSRVVKFRPIGVPSVASSAASRVGPRVPVRVRCAPGPVCLGTATLRHGSVVLGGRAYRLRGGASATLPLALTARGRAALRGPGLRRVTLHLLPTQGAAVTRAVRIAG